MAAKQTHLLWRISAAFVFVFALIVGVNHYCFRTYALDLGIYTNALYDYAHFRWNDAAVFKEQAQNVLSDHFDLSLVLLSPLSLLFGQFTLLIVQIFSMVLGAFGAAYWVRIRCHRVDWQWQIMLLFYLFFGVYSALSFVYHSNVLAACLLPWLLAFVHQKQWLKVYVTAFLMLICKEIIAIWMVGIALFIAHTYWQDKTIRRHAFILLLSSLSYALLVLYVIMPALSLNQAYNHYKYHALGQNYAQALVFCFAHPIDLLKIMFTNTSQNNLFDWVKIEFWVFIMLSGAWAVCYNPRYLYLLGIPLVSKMAYDDPAVWSIDCHYSIEFAPILVMLLAEFKAKWKGIRLPWAVLIALNAIVSIRLMDHTVYMHDYNRLRVYQKGHYERGFNLTPIRQAIDGIPKQAVVSAQSSILPHLAYRDKVYQFPIVKDAQWIILSEKDVVTYPLNALDYHVAVQQLLKDTSWQVVIQKPEVLLFKRR